MSAAPQRMVFAPVTGSVLEADRARRPATVTGNDTVSDRSRNIEHFRRVLGHYPTGVSIVTSTDVEGNPVGMVVGSFTSASIEPPLVAFFAMVTSGTYAKIRTAGRFCVNVLGADQEALCRSFATRGVDKFAGLPWQKTRTGSPVLDDAVAWIDCETEVIHRAGDHDIVIGRVVDLDVGAPRPSLLFFQGGYGSFSPRSLLLRDERFAGQLQLLDEARPIMESVASATGTQVVAIHCDGTELTLLASAGTATDERIPQVFIGQRQPVQPPIGMWWMAFADDVAVKSYLSGLRSDLRERCQDTLTQIRRNGFALGSSRVQRHIGTLIQRHVTAPQGSLGQSVALSLSDFDPDDYNPARVTPDTLVGDTPNVVNLWAPSFDADGKPSLGFMLTGFPIGTPLLSHALTLLGLAHDVTELAAH